MALLRTKLSIFLAILCGALVAAAQQQPLAAPESASHAGEPAFTPELRKFIDDLRENGTIPGLSVAIVRPEGKIELEGFGKSTEDGDKLVPETLFNLASCSKAFVTGSVGILMDDFAHGRNVTPLPSGVKTFDWHTKVKDLLPDDWKLMDEWATEKASVRDILSHVSGVPRHDLSYGPSDTPLDLIHRLQHLRPSFELREKWQYNNQMYILTSHLISVYSGKPYIEFVKERIFTPLDMTTTTFSESEALQTGLLTHSFNAVGRRLPFWFPDTVKVLNAGAGGVISSAHDLTRWVQTLLNEGVDPITNRTILPKSTYEAVTSAYAISAPAPFPELSILGYGLGWFRESYLGHEIVRHSGAIPGFSTQVVFLPHDKIGIVVLLNASNKANQAIAIVYRIIESLLKLPHAASSRYVEKAKNVSTASSSARGSLPTSSPRSATVSGAIGVTAKHNDFPLEKYVGTYTNPGYHNVTICSPLPSTSVNPICQETLAEFKHFDDLAYTSNSTLYLAVPNTWVRNARLTRSDGEEDPQRFTATFTYLFPHGYGRNVSAFELSEDGEDVAKAQFVVEGGDVIGFGMNQSDVTEVTERQKRGGSVKDTAGVWFEKV